MERGATFDQTKLYRYKLWRHWNDAAPRVIFVMLNPSTADDQSDDPTIRRCIRLAQTWGYGSLEVLNLFALVATHPRMLRQAIDPVGQDNDRYLLTAQQQTNLMILAWGNGGTLYQRDRAVLNLLNSDHHAHCLGITLSGQPRHPLYVRGDTQPAPYPIHFRI